MGGEVGTVGRLVGDGTVGFPWWVDELGGCVGFSSLSWIRGREKYVRDDWWTWQVMVHWAAFFSLADLYCSGLGKGKSGYLCSVANI